MLDYNELLSLLICRKFLESEIKSGNLSSEKFDKKESPKDSGAELKQDHID